MTDNEIIKALECCYTLGVKCDECPLETDCVNDNNFNLEKLVIDLFKRQKAYIDGLIAGQETLQKRLAEVEGVEGVKWISVKERLPDKTGSYLVIGREGGAYVMRFFKNEYNTKGKFNSPHIRYWAERPQPPKEGVEK